ncbi:hypothetical protein [Actinocrispum wychmicini]|uniref:DUF4333 domain-containing protein n=1 Tax=Actinocrispum wychmicini TaxID=1213861 RepID=A0A4R2JLF3_9PSEU|nr:hypothetical protein [Actinocrispum wychmicini]TCO59412.1 hypothetical protein EV192_104253 [Actinocrispum wychmicini]
MRTIRVGVLIAGVALAVAACTANSVDSSPTTRETTATSAASTSSSAPRPVQGVELPMPVEVTGPEPDLLTSNQAYAEFPPASVSLPVMEQLAQQMRKETVLRSGIRGRFGAASCPRGGLTMRAGATTTCTIRYEGVDVPWNITIGDDYQRGSQFFDYRVTGTVGVLRARAVHGLLWNKASRVPSQRLRCDAIPEMKVVQLGPTGYRCQYLDTTGASDALMWTVVQVVVDEDGELRLE